MAILLGLILHRCLSRLCSSRSEISHAASAQRRCHLLDCRHTIYGMFPKPNLTCFLRVLCSSAFFVQTSTMDVLILTERTKIVATGHVSCAKTTPNLLLRPVLCAECRRENLQLSTEPSWIWWRGAAQREKTENGVEDEGGDESEEKEGKEGKGKERKGRLWK